MTTLSLDDISLPTDGIDWPQCLEHWQWLLDGCPNPRVFLVTCFAELFVLDEQQRVWCISTANGNKELIAESVDDFHGQFEDPDFVDYFFMPQVVLSLREAGETLAPGQCYGFRVPTVFTESTLENSNFKVTDMARYLMALGDAMREIVNAESGDQVKFEPVV
ncbi:MAG: hypothetical protein ACPG4N_03770 [Gammaproteobacteria bacterium]